MSIANLIALNRKQNLNLNIESLYVGGNTGINGSSSVDINGTKALLLPRLTELQRTSLTPENGMIIYNSDDGEFQFYENNSWIGINSINSVILGWNSNSPLDQTANGAWMAIGGGTVALPFRGSIVAPYDGIITSITAASSVAPGTGKTWIFTVWINGSFTLLNCFIIDTDTSGSQTGSIIVHQNDLISVFLGASMGLTAGSLACSIVLESV